jgi:hypothetical protein
MSFAATGGLTIDCPATTGELRGTEMRGHLAFDANQARGAPRPTATPSSVSRPGQRFGAVRRRPRAKFCECIHQQLTTKQGMNTEDKFKAVLVKVQTASASGNPTVAALPKEFTAATLACKV